VKTFINGFIAISAMMLPNFATAGVITPTSYSYTNGTPAGESAYLDTDLTKLTDGLAGTASPVDGTWVGWQFSDGGAAQITFNFASSVTIANVDLSLLRSDIGNVQLPESVTINADSFAVSDFPTDNTSGFVDFAGSWTGDSIVVTLNHPGQTHWVFINEAVFSTPADAPEPATFALAGMALAGLILARKRFTKLVQ
jgi:PEP-CTERM motif